eukprot:2240182-Alexandrium_andersonii.AAC.1
MSVAMRCCGASAPAVLPGKNGAVSRQACGRGRLCGGAALFDGSTNPWFPAALWHRMQQFVLCVQ